MFLSYQRVKTARPILAGENEIGHGDGGQCERVEMSEGLLQQGRRTDEKEHPQNPIIKQYVSHNQTCLKVPIEGTSGGCQTIRNSRCKPRFHQ